MATEKEFLTAPMSFGDFEYFIGLIENDRRKNEIIGQTSSVSSYEEEVRDQCAEGLKILLVFLFNDTEGWIDYYLETAEYARQDSELLTVYDLYLRLVHNMEESV